MPKGFELRASPPRRWLRNNVINFNGNAPVFISTVGTADATSWNARTDSIGLPTYGATLVLGDKSFYRNAGVTTPTKDYDATQWTQKTNTEVDSAPEGVSWRLGYHVK